MIHNSHPTPALILYSSLCLFYYGEAEKFVYELTPEEKNKDLDENRYDKALTIVLPELQHVTYLAACFKCFI